MPLFHIKAGTLTQIKEEKFALEKDLQKITEDNLETTFGLKLIASEFQLNNLRIDTLAYDEENKSFVIIEYKRDRNFSVIDQGYSYLSLLLNNKAKFVLNSQDTIKSLKKEDDIDWSQSKIIFIANSFTTYQQNAVSFKDLPIELWEVKKYDNKSVLYNQLKSPDTNESIKIISKQNTTIENVNKEVKKYTISQHLNNRGEHATELFDEFRSRILNIDSRIVENPKQKYISYQINNKNIIGVKIKRYGLKITITRTRPKDLKDTKKKLKYIKNSMQYYNQHQSEFRIENREEIDYGMNLIKQVYEQKYM